MPLNKETKPNQTKPNQILETILLYTKEWAQACVKMYLQNESKNHYVKTGFGVK